MDIVLIKELSSEQNKQSSMIIIEDFEFWIKQNEK